MRRLNAAIVALLLAVLALPADAQRQPTGDWHGELATPNGKLMLLVRIRAAGDTLAGDLESPDQAAGQRMPLARITAAGDRLAFSVPAIGAAYEGRWDAAAGAWTGVFSQGMSLALQLKAGPPPAGTTIAGLDGTWRGVMRRDSMALRLVLRVTTSARGTRASLDSPDAGAMGMPVDELARATDSIRFTIPMAQVTFAGRLSADGRRLAGRWERAGLAPVDLTFERDSAGPPLRTQYPVKPSGYRGIDVSFRNPLAPGVTLAATLTLPESSRPVPAVVLISGSGGQDRDETIFGHKPFAVLADHLSRNGIAVLRYDDRGIGASTGNHTAATSADFATDANAAVRYLLTRPEIDAKAIGFAGHSEGGLIGPLAAVDNERVAFVVLLAGPGTTTIQVMLAQRRAMAAAQGVRPEQLAPSQAIVERLYHVAASTADSAAARDELRAILTADALAALGIPPEQGDALVAQQLAPWMRWFLRYDPAPTLARLRVPVLAIGGSLDVQVVSGENLPAIERALAANGDATIVELPGLNHFFQPARTGAMSEYRDIPETFSPAAMELVTRWIRERFGAPSGGGGER